MTIFRSKANTLLFLKPKLQKSKIEDLMVFNVHDWQKNKDGVVQKIQKSFNSEIIIRSSARGEDSREKSEAGTYTSILNISPKNNEKIINAVEEVIASYKLKNNKDSQNEILVQTMAKNVISSGVVFTRAGQLAAPYYVINYVEGEDTEIVTGGLGGKIIRIFRDSITANIPIRWKSLLNAVKEIEKILNDDLLDIEYAITEKHEVIIFQVRPLTASKKRDSKKADLDVRKEIIHLKKNLRNFQKRSHIPGRTTYFSDMSDWNPSEIIGSNPNLLDYSLYDYLIMKNSWHEGRSLIGYQDVNPCCLMVKFGNKPYIDLRGSFNSLIPKRIETSLKNKLVNYYLQKVSENPQLHDKVEFDILFSCYDFNIDYRLKDLTKYRFDENEISEIKKELIEFTTEIIRNFPKLLSSSNERLTKMVQNKEQIVKELSFTKKTHIDYLDAAKKLLDDCKNYGVVQFSMMARIAFIGSILLKSIIKESKITTDSYHEFMNSVSSIISEFQHDLELLKTNILSRGEFMKKYGHLRPGTYDITAVRYDRNRLLINNFDLFKTKKKLVPFKDEDKINEMANKYDLTFDNITFLSFVRESLKQRERIKFEFTKNLSDSLECIAKAANLLGFSRHEIANLSIDKIFDTYAKLSKKELISRWQKEILMERKKRQISEYLILPPLIFSDKDFELNEYYFSKPNFITDKRIVSDITELKDINNKLPVLNNKIILIENADPGYDWIFTKNPIGLITKYGGVASHMAIRCAELGLPAAIGCGETFYDNLKDASKIMLDCKNEQLIILEKNQPDQFSEEKKVLKSLGYIK